jgi:uncharacterized protein
MSANQLNRIAAMIGLIENSQSVIGRTALMKLCFFLQTLRHVPLGYSFSLYSYGPFDSDVMSDLQTAEGLDALKSQTVMYAGGYGYSISASGQASEVKKYSSTFLEKCSKDVEWVASTFGKYTASQLELLSTAVFVSIKEKALTNQSISDRVHMIKPHFTMSQIQTNVEWLDQSGFLRQGEL